MPENETLYDLVKEALGTPEEQPKRRTMPAATLGEPTLDLSQERKSPLPTGSLDAGSPRPSITERVSLGLPPEGAPSFDFMPHQAAAPYLGYVKEAEKKYDIPENLLARLVDQESRYNPGAVSPKGAVGIAQIMPNYHPDVDPRDPVASIDYAGKYLRELHDQFGDWSKAVAAYNAGPSAVERGMDKLPAETNDYLSRILGVGTAQAATRGGRAPEESLESFLNEEFRVHPKMTVDRILGGMWHDFLSSIGDRISGVSAHIEHRMDPEAYAELPGYGIHQLWPTEQGELLTAIKEGGPGNEKQSAIAYWTRRKAESLEKLNAEANAPVFQVPEEFKGISSGRIESIFRGGAQSAGMMGSFIFGGPVIGGMDMYFQTLGATYKEATADPNVDREAAFIASALSAAAQVPMESWGTIFELGVLKKMAAKIGATGGIGKAAEFIWTLFQVAAAEGFEEYCQQHPDEIARIYIKHPDYTIPQLIDETRNQWRRIHGEATEAMIIGGGVGALFTGVGGAVHGVGRIAEKVATRQPPPDIDPGEIDRLQEEVAENLAQMVREGALNQIRADLDSGGITIEQTEALREHPEVQSRGLVDGLNGIILDYYSQQPMVGPQTGEEVYGAERAGETVEEAGKEEGPVEGTVGGIRVRDTEEDGVGAGAGEEVTPPEPGATPPPTGVGVGEAIPEVEAGKAPEVPEAPKAEEPAIEIPKEKELPPEQRKPKVERPEGGTIRTWGEGEEDLEEEGTLNKVVTAEKPWVEDDVEVEIDGEKYTAGKLRKGRIKPAYTTVGGKRMPSSWEMVQDFRATDGTIRSLDADEVWEKLRVVSEPVTPAGVQEELKPAPKEEEAVAPDGWRDHLIKARMYAKDLGIPFQGLALEEIVAKIDERLGVEAAPEPVGKTPAEKFAQNLERKGAASVAGVDYKIIQLDDFGDYAFAKVEKGNRITRGPARPGPGQGWSMKEAISQAIIDAEQYFKEERPKEPAPKKEKPEPIEIVEELGGAPAEKTATQTLADHGLTVAQATTKNGKTVWEVSGNTKDKLEAIKAIKVGGQRGMWYGAKKVWTFYKGDPTEALAAELVKEGPKLPTGEAQPPEGTATPEPTEELAGEAGTLARVEPPSVGERVKLKTGGIGTIESVRDISQDASQKYWDGSRHGYVLRDVSGMRASDRHNVKDSDIAFIRKMEGVKVVWVPYQSTPWPPTGATGFGDPGNLDIPKLALELSKEIATGNTAGWDKVKFQQWLAEKLGISRSDLVNNPKYLHKQAEEAFEYGIVLHAKDYIANARADGKTVPEIYGYLKNLYENQPNLATRTGASIKNQGYSTPVHLAYLMGEMIGVTSKDAVYEPTAGNGMLLIRVPDSAKVRVNEIDETRAQNLRDQGYKVTMADGKTAVGNERGKTLNKKSETVILANPPFGSIPTETIDGYKISKLEHAIIMNALDAMTDDGRAVFIIGQHNFENGKQLENQKVFLNWLYHHYNVVANIDIPGEAYGRQGTKWPVRVVAVEGRKETPAGWPPQTPEGFQAVKSVDDIVPVIEEIRDGKTPSSLAAKGTEAVRGGEEGAGGARPEGLEGGRGELPPIPGEQGEGPVPEGEKPEGLPGELPGRAGPVSGGEQPGGVPGTPEGTRPVEQRPTRPSNVPEGEEVPGTGEGVSVRGRPGQGPREPGTVQEGVGGPEPGRVPGTNDLTTISPDDLLNILDQETTPTPTPVAESKGLTEVSQDDLLNILEDVAEKAKPEEDVEWVPIGFRWTDEGLRYVVEKRMVPKEKKSTDEERLNTRAQEIIRDLVASAGTEEFGNQTFRTALKDAEKNGVTIYWGLIPDALLPLKIRDFQGKRPPKAPPKTPPKVPPQKPPGEMTAAERLKRIAENAKKINQILGTKGALTEEQIDKTKWDLIKPVIGEMWDDAVALAKTPVEFVRETMTMLGQEAKGYFQHWIRTEFPKLQEEAKKPKEIERETTEYQTTYAPKSKGPIIDETLMPRKMLEAVTESLDRLEQEVGDVDTYVQEKLGYKDQKKLYKAFSADQIDAIALAINNLDKGVGMIVGDQTGVGKGRIAAAIWRYARKQGMKPVFFTEKPNLFTDFNRDITDIGHTFHPFIMASNEKLANILDENGNLVQKVLGPTEQRRVTRALEQIGLSAISDYDGLITNYSQVNKMANRQQKALEPLMSGNQIILDECHNAAGVESNTGLWMRQQLAGARGVLYMSATFAKRAEMMPLYFRTGMSQANLTMEQLVSAVEAGGTALQEIMSNALARLGQYVRREKSFKGIDVKSYVDTKNRARDEKRSDEMTGILRDILAFDSMVEGVLDDTESDSKHEGGQIGGITIDGPVTIEGGGRVTASVTGSNFAAVVHNAIRQLLLSMKADLAVDKAIQELEAGRKPVIAVSNTMGSFLGDMVGLGKIAVGDRFNMTFSQVLDKLLNRCLSFTVTQPDGSKVKGELNPEELPPKVFQEYERIRKVIEKATQDLPGSPIDYIKIKLAQAGYNVGEITGRTYVADYSDLNNPILKERSEKEKASRNQIIQGFNNGEIEALVINAAGATGLSIHAGPKFKDKRPRSYIGVQGELNVDTEVQKMGRINRKGQVVLPRYESVYLDTPAEIRPASVLQKKLKSLSANTSANSDSPFSKTAHEIPDMLNKYGNQVVAHWVEENERIAARVGIHAGDANMQKVTGRMALQSVSVQRQFYQDIEGAYKETIAEAKEMGTYDLEVEDINYKAKGLEKVLLTQGKDESNPFGESTYREKLEVESPRKPFKLARIRELVNEFLKGRAAEDFNDEFLAKVESDAEAYIAVKNKEEDNETVAMNRADSVRRQAAAVRDTFSYNDIKVGNGYTITLTGATQLEMRGVLMSVRQSAGTGSPVAPSRIKLVFAVNNGMQRFTVPLSRIDHREILLGPLSKSEVAEWDDQTRGTFKENVYMITGNLLQGYADAPSGSKIVRFTMKDGTVREGIQLPRSYNPAREHREVRVTADQAVKIVEAGHGIMGPEVSINRTWHGETTIEVPRGKATGQKYFNDETLKGYTEAGEFETRGQKMRAVLTGNKVADAIRRVYEIGETFSVTRLRFNEVFGENAAGTEEEEGATPGEVRKPFLRVEGEPRRGLDESRPTAKDVQNIFKGQEVLVQPDGSVVVNIRKGYSVTIKSAENVPLDVAVINASYGRSGLEPGEVVAGLATTTGKTGEILLHRVYGNKWVLAHESMHFLKDSGILTPMDAAIIQAHVKKLFKAGEWTPTNAKDVGGDEDQASFLADALMKPPPTGAIGKILAKIQEWIDRFVSYVKYVVTAKRTTAGVVERIKSGAVFGGEFAGEATATTPHYALKVVDPKAWADSYLTQVLGAARGSEAVTEIEADFDENFLHDGVEAGRAALDKLKKVWKQETASGRWKAERPDTNIIDRIFFTPEHYFEKVPAAQRVYEAAAKKPDNFYHLLHHMTNDNGVELLSVMKTLQKNDKDGYGKLRKALLDADRNKTKLTAEDLAKKGYSDQVIKAWVAYRTIMNKGFDLMSADMRALIEKCEKNGLPIPEVVVVSGGKKVTVDLKQALKLMGDMRGYYAPRIRKSGRFQLVAKKEGASPVLKFFDAKFLANRAADDLEKQGYTVQLQKNKNLPEDVFNIAGQVVGIQAILNKALEKVTKPGEEAPSLEGLGLTGRWDGETYVIEGPWNVVQSQALKSLGGKWYSPAKGGQRAWRFDKAPKDMEQRIVKRLFEAESANPDTTMLFAALLAENVADVIKGRGFRGSMIKRGKEVGEEVWLGYEEDPLKNAALYARGLAAGTAKKQMVLDMVRATTGTDIDRKDFDDYKDYLKAVRERRIDPGAQKNIFHDVVTFMDDMRRNEEAADRVLGWVKGLATLKYLGFRVAAPIVNLTALVTSVPAAMEGYAGIPIVKTAGYLTRAMELYRQYNFGNRAGMDPEIVKMFDAIRDRGWDVAQFNRETLAVLQSRVGDGWSRRIESSMFMFQKTEQLNRAATIAATYLGAKDKGMGFNEALELGKKVSDKGHGVYGKHTMPHWARGSSVFAQAAKAFYVFKKFSHNYLQTMYDLGVRKHDIKAAGFMAIAPAILAGAGASVLMPFVRALFKAFGHDDPEEDFYAWVAKYLGEYGERFARFGAMGTAARGVSIKSSLQIGITDIPTSFADLLGAPGSIVADAWSGVTHMVRGNVYKGVEQTLPIALGGLMRAYREYHEGLTKTTNAPIFYKGEPVSLNFLEALSRATGFNPARIAQIKEEKWSEVKVSQKYDELRSDIYSELRKFYSLPEAERTKDKYVPILEKIEAYNKRVMDRGKAGEIEFITRDSIRGALRQAFRPKKRELISETKGD